MAHEALHAYHSARQEKKDINDRHALIDEDGRIVHVSSALAKECAITALPILYREVVSSDLYAAKLADVLYDVHTSQKSIPEIRKRFERAKSHGIDATADHLQSIGARFAKQGARATRTMSLSARLPTMNSGHRNYHEKLTFVQKQGEYAGALAEFKPVSDAGIGAFLWHVLRYWRKPQELFVAKPEDILRVHSLDKIELVVDQKRIEKNYLADYVTEILRTNIVRSMNVAGTMLNEMIALNNAPIQKDKSGKRMPAEYDANELRLRAEQKHAVPPQMILDARDLKASELTAGQFARLLCVLDDKNRSLIVGNATPQVEDAVYAGMKLLQEKLGRKPALKSLHFRTLLYEFPQFPTYKSLENELQRILYPHANPVSNESVRADEPYPEGKSLDVLVDSESAEQQP